MGTLYRSPALIIPWATGYQKLILPGSCGITTHSFTKNKGVCMNSTLFKAGEYAEKPQNE